MRNNLIISFCLLLSALLLAGCGSGAAQTLPDQSEGLTISAATLSGEPSFIDWTQSETPMQLIARKGSEGDVRLAFNTCQSCNGSPWAWFEYLGDGVLQCQNCMQLFSVDAVGVGGASGCSPIPVSGFTHAGDTVTVSSKVLADAAPLFANWKRTDK